MTQAIASTATREHAMDSAAHVGQCGFLRLMPPELQERCKTNPHVVRYLHDLPTDEMGIPQYYPKLNKKLGDLKYRNLFYPVSDDVLIHVWSKPGEERDLYIPVEPTTKVALNGKLAQVEERLLRVAHRFDHSKSTAERAKALTDSVKRICTISKSKGNGGGWRLFPFFGKPSEDQVRVSAQEFNALKYMMVRDKVGLGVLQPMVFDPNIEDISCSGVGNVYVEHKVFKSMKSAITFTTHEDLDQFVLRLSDQIKRPVTVRNPIVDAVLPDGSRINIVYGREVSQRGSNFTIRKFGDTPLSIFELIEFGALDYRMAAYMSFILEEGMNTFVSGETASGKTTLMNALTTFVSPSAKIVSIEDTPEVQVPHKNWLREVAKNPRAGEKGATVTMMDLLKAALRQRPNLIIVGEIRGEEGAIAFQAMQTGHAVMATFHASTVEKLIQRLTGHPINIPKTYIDNLNVVVVQSAVKLPNGKQGRRALSVSEIVGYDPVANSFSFVEVFRWNPSKDIFEFVGDKNSYLLEQKIAFRRGIPPNKKWEIYQLLDRRAKVLEKLHKEKKVVGFHELYQVLAEAQRKGLF